MPSSVILSVVCLVLIQNLVYTLPATDPQVAKSSQGTSNAEPKILTTTITVSSSTEPSHTSMAPTVKKTTTEDNTEKTESETKKPEVKDPVMSTEGPAAPSSQAQDEHKGGSATVYANLGMLLVTASVLMRL